MPRSNQHSTRMQVQTQGKKSVQTAIEITFCCLERLRKSGESKPNSKPLTEQELRTLIEIFKICISHLCDVGVLSRADLQRWADEANSRLRMHSV